MKGRVSFGIVYHIVSCFPMSASFQYIKDHGRKIETRDAWVWSTGMFYFHFYIILLLFTTYLQVREHVERPPQLRPTRGMTDAAVLLYHRRDIALH